MELAISLASALARHRTSSAAHCSSSSTYCNSDRFKWLFFSFTLAIPMSFDLGKDVMPDSDASRFETCRTSPHLVLAVDLVEGVISEGAGAVRGPDLLEQPLRPGRRGES